jgi:hypothetical protein
MVTQYVGGRLRDSHALWLDPMEKAQICGLITQLSSFLKKKYILRHNPAREPALVSAGCWCGWVVGCPIGSKRVYHRWIVV